MMRKLKYHPLVDADSDGEGKIPMFFSMDERTVAGNHALYLEELVPHYFRLIARQKHSCHAQLAYKIHCPSCGYIMQAVTGPVDEHRLALYTCPKCN